MTTNGGAVYQVLGGFVVHLGTIPPLAVPPRPTGLEGIVVSLPMTLECRWAGKHLLPRPTTTGLGVGWDINTPHSRGDRRQG